MTSPSSDGVLSRIRPVAASAEGRLKVSLYGAPKSGKTRLACTFPKPLLIIGSEDGTESVVGSEGVDFVLLEKTSEFSEIVHGPVKAGQYKTVVVDNATKLRDLHVSGLLGLERAPVQKSWGYAGREVWIQTAMDLKEMLRDLLDLPRLIPLNVVIIAHEQTYKGSEEGGSSASDVIQPVIGSAVGESVCRFINAECGYVCQTFIREQQVRKITQVAGQNVEQWVRTGKREYCLRTAADGLYMAGFRVPLGRPNPPDVIVDPSYEKITKVIRGEKV